MEVGDRGGYLHRFLCRPTTNTLPSGTRLNFRLSRTISGSLTLTFCLFPFLTVGLFLLNSVRKTSKKHPRDNNEGHWRDPETIYFLLNILVLLKNLFRVTML